MIYEPRNKSRHALLEIDVGSARSPEDSTTPDVTAINSFGVDVLHPANTPVRRL